MYKHYWLILALITLIAGILRIGWLDIPNLWIDELRSREVRLKAANDEVLESNEMVNDDKYTQLYLDTQKVLHVMNELPENQRLALSLVAVENMSYAEAAEVLDVPIGTIMSRVARARVSLMKRFYGSARELLQ